MSRLALLANLPLLALLLACGGGVASERHGGGGGGGGATVKLLHSPELNEIMKNEVNQPFSALMFLVFHSAETNPDGELDFAKIEAPVATLQTGIAKVQAMVNPPVQTTESREVFLAYVDSLVRDSASLAQALAGRDRPRMEKVLEKITQTCNDCHHFFRLKVVGEGPPPPSVVMVELAFVP